MVKVMVNITGMQLTLILNNAKFEGIIQLRTRLLITMKYAQFGSLIGLLTGVSISEYAKLLSIRGP